MPKQILDVDGDWIARRPDVRPGGWAFQYANPHYPDVDDTAVVAMAMDRAQGSSAASDFRAPIARAREWIVGMQSKNGGWGAFDADNEYDYLNNIPFADHGALLDPPTEDVTARCVSMLAQLGETADNSDAVARAVDYLRRTQHAGGQLVRPLGHELHLRHLVGAVRAQRRRRRSWRRPKCRKAVAWLVAIQNADGGWGEDGASYKLDYRGYEPAPSTASQTAWALLGLMAAGEVDHPAVSARHRLSRHARKAATASGTSRATPRPASRACSTCATTAIAKFFPLWALARYRNLNNANARACAFGM